MKLYFGYKKVLLIALLIPQFAFSWGRMGHDLGNRTAAMLLAKTSDKSFFRTRAYDLGYYGNVPDLVWKRGPLYEVEWFNHFMDLETFEREIKKSVDDGKLSAKEDVFDWDRSKVETKLPSLPNSAGRAYWRIRELEKKLAATASLLKQKDLLKDERHRLQAEWLVIAGTMGHYVLDLAQPLHVTENYDGQLSNQRGVHNQFEEVLVDALWPSIETPVAKEAEKIWEKEQNIFAGKSVLQLLRDLAAESTKEAEDLLKKDKKTPREDLKKSTEVFRLQITKRIAAGAAVLTEIWRRNSNWQPNEDKFFIFSGEPKYIEAPKAVPIEEVQKPKIKK